ncbi:MAG: hypothetical protein IJF58_05630 [Clostridia bacterium]|nr:hypothetical protein [Clostridia bacterium]
MFSIFVALFGGLYFAGRRAYEKSLSDKHDSDFRMGQINKALMVNRKFEDELVKKIADPHYREEIEALVKEDLQCIYGDAWKELFAGDWYEPRAYTTSFGSKEGIILMLMLSKSGLIPSYYQYAGIEISNFDISNIYECLKILQCVEKNVRAKKDFLDARLVFVPQIMHCSLNRKGDVGTPNYANPSTGKFYWNFEPVFACSRFAVYLSNSVLVNACKEASIGERSLASNPYKDKLTL